MAQRYVWLLRGSISLAVMAGLAACWYVWDQGFVVISRPPGAIRTNTEMAGDRAAVTTLWVPEHDVLRAHEVTLVHPCDAQNPEHTITELVQVWLAAMHTHGVIPTRCVWQDISYGRAQGVLVLTCSSSWWAKQASTRQCWLVIQALCATLHAAVPGAVSQLYIRASDGQDLPDDRIYCGEPFQPEIHSTWPITSDVARVAASRPRNVVVDVSPFWASKQGRYVQDSAERTVVQAWVSNWAQKIGSIRPILCESTATPSFHAHTVNRARPACSVSVGLYAQSEGVPRVTVYVYGHKVSDGWRITKPTGAFVPYQHVHRYSVPTSVAYARDFLQVLQARAGGRLAIDDICMLPTARVVGRDHPAFFVEVGVADRSLCPLVERLVGQALAEWTLA